MDKKKIVFFTNRMIGGGSERVISYLANSFANEFEIEILTMTCAKSDYVLASKVKHIPMEKVVANNNHSLFTNFIRYRNLKKHINNYPYATYISFVAIPSYILLFLRKNVKGKIIVAVRNDPKSSQNTFLDKLLIKWLYPKADAFIFQTKEMKDFFTNIKIQKSIILPNPLNEQFIKKPYHGEREKIIVSVGRLIEQKNQRLLIQAFCDVSVQLPEYKLLIYGDGYLKEKLENQIKQLGMEGRIILAGTVKNLENIIYRAGLFVLASNFEGVSNALLEAMSLGLPVIATNSLGGGTQLIIKNRENGLLVPTNNKEELSNAILEVLTKPKLARSLSNNAHKIVEKAPPKEIIQLWKNFINGV